MPSVSRVINVPVIFYLVATVTRFSLGCNFQGEKIGSIVLTRCVFRINNNLKEKFEFASFSAGAFRCLCVFKIISRTLIHNWCTRAFVRTDSNTNKTCLIQYFWAFYHLLFPPPFTYFVFLKNVLGQSWKAFKTKFGPQWKYRESSYEVRSILALFCK